MARRKRNKRSDISERYIRVMRFFIKFNLFAIPLYIILFSRWTLVELQKLVADIMVWLLSNAGYAPTIRNFIISIPIRNGDWAAVINWDCTGWKSMLAFFALMMATDHPMKRKLLGLVLIPVIFVVNIIRIFFMFYYVKNYDLANYQLVHSVVWSWGLIITIAVLWIVWLKWDFTKLGRK